ncbi:DUF6538 domain-containing protein [Rhodoblastus acidophilus]|uniref:DUF6538 domain-containing protein n=1 Tax=Rhodoblastus acidophilus TaxID=1074 RepID=UPI003CD00D44
MSHIDAATTRVNGCKTVENRRSDCSASLSHNPATHRQKQRPTGLWLRGTVWQFRMRVPRECEETVGRKFVSRSLRTSDYREAIRKARLVASELQQSFDAIRADNDDSSGRHFSAQVPAPPTSIYQAEEQRQPRPITAPRKPELTLKALYERYISDPAAERSPKTMLAYNSTFNRLAELVGEDTPIGAGSDAGSLPRLA